LAQVRGLRGETLTVDAMAKRVESDLDYIDRWSLALDLWILLRTPFALFSGKVY
jgi:putative colanic acid biosynthesis UDP-glucose lipid carrier transferase